MTSALLIAWMLFAALSTYAVFVYWRNVACKFDALEAEGVAVIIPIKGGRGQDDARSRFLASCMNQRRVGSYRLIFAVESATDPAAADIAELAARDARVSLIVAGRASKRGQKVHNQVTALETLSPDDRYVVFADADVEFASDWLSELLRPILWGTAELTSGYRWILPANDGLASRFCALMDWGVATAPRSRRWNTCWGGSIAISRAALDRIDLPRWWAATVLDDYTMTMAARRAGISVFAAHQVLVPSPVRHDMRSLFNFGRRQYLMTRVHAFQYWLLAGVVLIVPTLAGGAAIAAAARGDRLALACIAAALALQQVRASLRIGIAHRVLPPEAAAQSQALMRRDRWMLPAAHLLHLAIWATSGIGRTTIWAGTRYRLLAFDRMEIMGYPKT